MRYTIIVLLILIEACSQPKQKIDNNFPPPLENYLTSKQTSRHAILKFDAKRDSGLFENSVQQSTLSDSELKAIESLISKRVALYNKTAYKTIKNPEMYFKQFIAVTNEKGEKEVGVDCFCDVNGDSWKTKPLIVNDGGSCFFHLRINSTTNVVTYFGVNGIG